jgi:protein gp37
MNETRIEWTDESHNPITGCLRGCAYCYARRKATQFGSPTIDSDLHVLDHRAIRDNGTINPYPFGFAPTFHRYRLDEPARKVRPRTIFWGSMADIFGPWIPDWIIEEIFDAARNAPQHRHLFLTKYPERFQALATAGKLPELKNFWFGSTITDEDTNAVFWSMRGTFNTFVSYEPILGPLNFEGVPPFMVPPWLILGAETGNRKDKVVPAREWVEQAVAHARDHDVAVFMKNSLRDLMGAEFVQEFPWEV